MPEREARRTGSTCEITAAVVPWEAEAWPIIEHEPEHIPVIPPDFGWLDADRASHPGEKA